MAAVELVVTALTAGAAVGMKDTAATAVKDAYTVLLSSVRRLLDHDDDVSMLDDPERHREQLLTALTAADAVSDEEVIAAARRLLAQLDQRCTPVAKYTVDNRDARGVQVGDGNTMHITA